ncbi:MAG TPA: ATP12 family protein [Thermohalobaculum sp.]|nr:ATP12 family protein [Thermohalobaculum sp.]
MRRFWKEVRLEQAGAGHALHLDHRPVRTPAGAALVLPSRPLAEAVAAEWRARGPQVDPLAMPLTRSANAAIDRVLPDPARVADAIAAYGASDLVCYRAPRPEGLKLREAEAWDPLVDWAAEALGAPLILVEGVMHVAQPPGSLARLGEAVRAHGPWELTALHELVTLSGSLVLGLAVSHGRLAPPAAWAASRIDEAWNIEEWGEDAEAAAAAERRRRDFLTAARLLELVRG